MKRLSRCGVVMLAVLGAVPSLGLASPVTLASVAFAEAGGWSGVPNSFTVGISVGPVGPLCVPQSAVQFDLPMTVANTVLNFSNPNFATAAALLRPTDNGSWPSGEDRWLALGFGDAGPTTAVWLNPAQFGFSLSSIAINVTGFVVNTPGLNPNGDGWWTDYSVLADVDFYGELEPVPEPCTLVFFGTGLVVLRLMKRRRKGGEVRVRPL
jgi:hypothetical protein